MPGPNAYSTNWFRTFLGPFPVERTRAQAAFLVRQLPLPRFKRVVDVCSGPGRIAGMLARAGYEVTAVDRDHESIEGGRRAYPAVAFIERDMRELGGLAGRFDAVICLWQSFGYFSRQENRRVLSDMALAVGAGGRLILDLYDRRYFEAHLGVDSRTIQGVQVGSNRRMEGERLKVTLDYGGRAAEEFDWELFSPRDLAEAAVGAGLKVDLLCADFDEGIAASEQKASFQAVLSRAEST